MRIIIEKDLAVTTADGVVLSTDVYRPDTTGTLPVLLQRTPYDKDNAAGVSLTLDVLQAAQSGYTVVVQDARGRYGSGGRFDPFRAEGADGETAIAWAASQPWSNGRVGMVGASYVGATQWLPATRSPAALQAIAPVVTSGDYQEGWVYQGGAFCLGFNLIWSVRLAFEELDRRQRSEGAAPPAGPSAPPPGSNAEVARLVGAIDAFDELAWRLPLRGSLGELADLATHYDEWLAHPDDDAYWAAVGVSRHYDAVTAPAFNVGGWYDLFVTGTLANWQGMRAAHAGDDLAHHMQRLVIGPWSHGVLGGAFPDHDYGAASDLAMLDLTRAELRFFDRLLKDADNGADTDKPVRLFVMGANEWRDYDDWPPPGCETVRWFLHSGGRAATLADGGGLSTEPPGAEPEDVVVADPANPVPTVGGQTYLPGVLVGANAGPRDQRAVETRGDVACYTTPPLEEPLEVIGPVELVLFASSSAEDTDFCGKLVDVHPDGRAQILTEGVLRARYRDSRARPSLLRRGEVYELRIDLVATANRFERGHRIRLEIAGSNFPRFDRNTNTGGDIAGEGLEASQVAVNRVHHSSAHPSHLLLPVVRRG